MKTIANKLLDGLLEEARAVFENTLLAIEGETISIGKLD